MENLGFTKIGGVGDMIYRAVRFLEYIAADRGGKCLSCRYGITRGRNRRLGTVKEPMQSVFDPQ